jgi:metallo-beta-lactamase family protein
VSLTPVGHLLGACAVTLQGDGQTLVFSGDVGRDDDLLMPPPQAIAGADVLLVESTYGNRSHPTDNAQAQLAEIVRTTVRRGGTVLLPSFAVGRAQTLMLCLQRLKAAGEIDAEVPVFLDSPMAATATELYRKHRKLLRLAPREANTIGDGVTVTATPQASEALSRSRYPRIIISASGMATGGRVLHHLKALAPNPRNHIVFPGFQVGGTRGAKMIEGATEVKIFGDYVAVKARVSHLEGFSGHADGNGLMRWLGHFTKAPRQTFVVHGEPAAADAMRSRIGEELGWKVSVPGHGTTVQV